MEKPFHKNILAIIKQKQQYFSAIQLTATFVRPKISVLNTKLLSSSQPNVSLSDLAVLGPRIQGFIYIEAIPSFN